MIRYQWSTHDLTSGQYSGSYDGIDISRHQGRIHWDELSKVKRLKFIYVKATEGATIKDPWYEANINQARKAIHNHISKLRKKLRFEPDLPNYIESVAGIGYKFEHL